MVLIPCHAQRDRDRMATVRETWTRDIDETHRCQRRGGEHLRKEKGRERCGSKRTVKYLFLLGEEAEACEEKQRFK